MRSDGGPQFRGELVEFCKENSITHELASDYNPKSNGLAEAAVKNVKLLMEKCCRAGECFDSALYVWKNTPRVDGKSPVQLLFGRRQLTSLPTRDVKAKNSLSQKVGAAPRRSKRLQDKSGSSKEETKSGNSLDGKSRTAQVH